MLIQSKTGSCIAAGKLVRDADFMHVGKNDTPLCKFSIPAEEQVNPDGTKTTTWINCVAWRDIAQRASGLRKGDPVLVCGKMSSRSYIGRDGDERTIEELTVEVFSTPGSSIADLEAFPNVAFQPITGGAVNIPFDEMDDDGGDLPF